MNDPRERAGQATKKARAAIEKNASVFMPLAEILTDAVRKGGRVLLYGEGPLHLLARHAAGEIVGRRHGSGVQLPCDALDASAGDPHAIARRIGPFDAILAVAGDCEDALFVGTLEAARSRGAKVACICVGKGARLVGRADVAVDIPEPRPHHRPGVIALTLHFIAKQALGRLAANPLVRPQRLDDGPARRPASPTHSGRAPALPMAEPNAVLPLLDAEDEASATIAIPEDELAIDFFDGVGDDAYDEPYATAPTPPPAPIITPVPAPPSADGVRLIAFRCKQCQQALVAGAMRTGDRALCPYCGRRVKVPRSEGRLYSRAEDAPGTPILELPPRTTVSLPREDAVPPKPVHAEEAPAARPAVTISPPANPPPGDAAGVSPARRPISSRLPRALLEEELRAAPAQKPGDSGEILTLALEAAAAAPPPMALRFRLDECRIGLGPADGGPLRDGRLEEVTPEGIEVSLEKAEAAHFHKGEAVTVRLVTPAFLEPLTTRTTLEHVLPGHGHGAGPSQEAGAHDSGRVRFLLPLDDDAPREVREKLARLFELAESKRLQRS